MTEWYYARGGQQNGPVSFEQLQELARNGGLDAAKDLVWTTTMKDWTPAGQVAELFTAPPIPSGAQADPSNPYATPQSTWAPAAPAANMALQEIVPGSEPLDVGACVSRGFELTKRHFGVVLLVGLTYFGIVMIAQVILGMIDLALGFGHTAHTHWQTGGGTTMASYQQTRSPLSIIASQVLSSFLSLGVTRIGLGLVSGRDVSVSLLFGEGRKLLRALVATLLFAVMLGIGLLLFIVPGVYIAMRFGQYLIAIVDRDLGIMDSFNYSSSLTTNNRMNLFLLALLAFVIVLAGALLCGIGLIIATPTVWLAYMTAYRWLQYGRRAALDQPGTTTPMLAGV